ncbi:DUF2530 domain-containing protein [Agromyces sp. Marseille-P2726]|uniref:DUF2530 domain-containing protein n=1 Tax=Agromyces sp. Marseille-P2726 TaxID=2709132 RepID=UPI001570ACDE|nr:DUF2530 domain-containing protein [Agromyces sp. Marseille-P2726]
MRFWLSESERRPDPAPARADARKALLVGTILWLIALIATLVFHAQLAAAALGWLMWACVIGSVLGLVGLAVVQVVRRRITRHGDGSTA